MGDESDIVTATVAMQNAGMATEDTIARMQRMQYQYELMTGWGSDVFVPTLQSMVNATKTYAQAEYSTGLALQFAYAQRKDAKLVSEALAQAYQGKTMALGKLLGLNREAVAVGADLNVILDRMEQLAQGVGEQMETQAAKMKKATTQWDMARKVLGAQLAPAVTQITIAVVNMVNGVEMTARAWGELGNIFSGIADIVRQNVQMVMLPAGRALAAFFRGDFKMAVEEGKRFVEQDWQAAVKGAVTDIVEEWKFGADTITGYYNDFLVKYQALAGQFEVPELMRPEGLGDMGEGEGAARAAMEAERLRMTQSAVLAGEHQVALNEIARTGLDDRRDMMFAALDEEAEYARYIAHIMELTQFETAQTMGRVWSGTIDRMTSMWSSYFNQVGKGEQTLSDMFAESGKAFLAMVLEEVQQRLQAKAIEYAILAGAAALALDFPHALGYAAAAALLGGATVLSGVAASALTSPPPQPGVAPPEYEPAGRAGGYEAGRAKGGTEIRASTVTVNINAQQHIHGNVYGIEDLRDRWRDWTNEVAFNTGQRYNTGGP